MDKHYSLLQKLVNYDRKIFYNIDSRCQQRDRKSFVEHDDLKVLEQHMADYLTLQTDNNKEKEGQNVSH